MSARRRDLALLTPAVAWLVVAWLPLPLAAQEPFGPSPHQVLARPERGVLTDTEVPHPGFPAGPPLGQEWGAEAGSEEDDRTYRRDLGPPPSCGSSWGSGPAARPTEPPVRSLASLHVGRTNRSQVLLEARLVSSPPTGPPFRRRS